MSNMQLITVKQILNRDTGEFFGLASTLESLTYYDKDTGSNVVLNNVFISSIDDYSIMVFSDNDGYDNIDIEDIVGFES